jgi:hypothetical protein
MARSCRKIAITLRTPEGDCSHHVAPLVSALAHPATLATRSHRMLLSGRSVIITYGVPKMSAYARLKRYRQKRSLEREAMYLAKRWPAGYRNWNAHQWAAVKRWFIYYHRRRQEREVGHELAHRPPRHWVGPQERKRKFQKRTRPTCNPVVIRHLLTF